MQQENLISMVWDKKDITKTLGVELMPSAS
jgi:hypothetical protein